MPSPRALGLWQEVAVYDRLSQIEYREFQIWFFPKGSTLQSPAVF